MSEIPRFSDSNALSASGVALDAADRFDDTRECTCEYDYGCWYYLSDEEQEKERSEYIAAAVAEAMTEGTP